ncbi:MAG TPA: hypothetical protein VEV17_21265 [Bryobacteraceae bacterium]|nr:hypothetical protein [Bryobacteraceae bacterium]
MRWCERLVLVIALTYATALAQPLRLEQTISLGNIAGRIDHMTADVAGKRVFVAALGNNTVEVVDVAAGRVTHSIPGLHEPQGLFYWPGQNRLFAANARDGHVRVCDGRSFDPISDYDFNSDADNIRFDPTVQEVFIGYGDGALGVISAGLKAQVGFIVLDAHPESFQLERQGPRIFINVPNAGNVTVVDRRTRSVIARWRLSAQSNFPMALDEADHRLFIGCRRPARLLALDTSSGQEVASIPIVGDTDDLFYDAALKRIYVSGGAGSITVVQHNGADHYASIATIPTAPGARTSLFVPEFKRLYVARPRRGKQEPALLVFSVSP